ncbi:MAG: hypothetical protein J5J06_02250 [Phycisphaerae bacterium]|nr:hypothetical protein [Phycisphaerae bacterium]
MAAHLARHQSTTHGTRTKKAGRPAGRGAASRGWPAGRLSYAEGNGAAQLRQAMQNYYDELNARRDAIEHEITNIATAMQSIGGTAAAAPARRGPGRPPGRPAAAGRGGRAGSLREYVVGVLKSSPEPMSPRDIAGAVQKSGYKTKAKDLTKAVSNLLPHLSGIKKVGFGKYKM